MLPRCVIPTVILSVLLAGLAGAAIFFIVYYILAIMSKLSSVCTPLLNVCPAYCPWTQMGTGCYQFFQDSRNWSAAQALCRRRGGRLAELDGEQNCVKSGAGEISTASLT